jgi:hypothetical protein
MEVKMTTVSELQAMQSDRLRAASDDDPESDEELFPHGSLDGDGISLKGLIKPGLPVEYTKSLLKGEVPGRKGLTNPEGERRAIVTHELAEVVIVIKREDGKITGYKIREKLRPTYVEAED